MKKFVFLIGIACVFFFFFAPQPKANWSGQLVFSDPIQTSDQLPSPWTKGGYTFSPQAHYQIQAVVLSKHSYWAGGNEDKLAPYDLALGWGPMSDANIINALKISQYGRWYRYSWKNSPPIDPEIIKKHSANNHIIAANSTILRQIKAIKRFDAVGLKGYLVNISKADGWSWNSSLSREDNAGGSCEVFWVESVQ